ncbi:hypothetical protein [Cytobacillus firmus]|uniref:hypothetical protein n=1 Tax=Cytobacillus firmus TaxID=1399 RepID=UPI001CFD7131|nr:hypothetical protein [Cytobacillus firmus]
MGNNRGTVLAFHRETPEPSPCFHVLNEEGGPNHVGNYCDAPVIVDTKKDEVHYNSSCY